jgi:predicted PurR-regulated permease PerM
MKASATVTADQIKEAKAFAQRCVEQEQAGEMAARLLLVELRGGGEPSSGARWLAPMIESLESSTKDLMEAVPRRLSSWAKDSMAGVDWVITFGLNLILIPIYAFFLILAMQNIRSGVREYLPAWRRDAVLRIIHDIERVVAAFFRGRLVVCLLCALVTYVGFIGIGFFGTGVPYAALFALLIGLATAIPLAGILFLIPAVLLNLLDGGSAGTATAMIVVYTVVQGLETFVFTPAIMGREVELHPVTLIVAILLCGKLIGVLGVILAVPIAATCRILAREFLWPRLKELAGRGTSARAPTIDTKL